MGDQASGTKQPAAPLTDEQRRLVRKNIGLVAVHLRRYVRNLEVPRSDREWEDLFQEGCLGLIRAALTFRSERGIPFAAFALPRIHNAVSRALQNKFSTVYIPPPRRRRDCDDAGTDQDRQAPTVERRPSVRSLPDESARQLCARRHDPETSDVETIGDRLRGKYERAVSTAACEASAQSSRRGDRDKLVRVLVDERFMIPHEESRTALRAIARQTRSSYARVAQCSQQLGEAVRRLLDSDPEFGELTRRARANPTGTSAPIDPALERDLAMISAGEFVDRVREADDDKRGLMLDALLQVSDADVADLLRERVGRLGIAEREKLMQRLADRPKTPGRA